MRNLSACLGLLALALGAPAAPIADQADLQRVESLLRERTNKFRSDHDLRPVIVDPRLAAAAQEFADFMARTGRYGHEADARTPVQRARSHGYDHCMVAENIAYQQSTPPAAVEELARTVLEGWIKSPGHRKNLLDADATQTGVAVSRASNGRNYAVQLMGRPASEKISFEISNESRATVRYRLGDKSYLLPPHSVRTHGSCRSESLAILARGSDGKVTPRDGDNLVVEENDGRLSVVRRPFAR